MLAGLCNCCQPTYRCGHACTPTKSHRHTHTQLFDFLQLNINMLITSSFNPSLKIPLKKSVAILLLPPSFIVLTQAGYTFTWMIARPSVMTPRTLPETLNMPRCQNAGGNFDLVF